MTTYNGWTNYPTWNVKLWLDNEPGTYDDALDLAERHPVAYKLADALKDYVEDLLPDLGGSMAADLLGWALCEVNWIEIAEAYLEEIEPEPVEDEQLA